MVFGWYLWYTRVSFENGTKRLHNRVGLPTPHHYLRFSKTVFSPEDDNILQTLLYTNSLRSEIISVPVECEILRCKISIVGVTLYIYI